MKVVECPECGGYVSVDADRCQNCGHWMKGEPPRPMPSQSRSAYQVDKGPLLQRRVPMFWRIVLVLGVIVFAIIINYLLFT